MQYLSRIFHPRNPKHFSNMSPTWKVLLPAKDEKRQWAQFHPWCWEWCQHPGSTHPVSEKGFSQKLSCTQIDRQPQLTKTLAIVIYRVPRTAIRHHFRYILSLKPHDNLWVRYCYPHCAGENISAPRGCKWPEEACSRVYKLGFELCHVLSHWLLRNITVCGPV